MNKKFIALQILRVSLGSSSLFCTDEASLQTTKAMHHAKVLRATRQKLINRLSERMNESCKSEVIEVVTKVPAECLNTFEAVVTRISEYMSVDDKFHVIKATAVVPTASLSLEFAEVFNRLTHRLSDRNRGHLTKER